MRAATWEGQSTGANVAGSPHAIACRVGRVGQQEVT